MNGRRTSGIRLSQHRGSRAKQIEFFAVVNLGIIQSLASGALTPAEAVQRFYRAANCSHVRRTLRSKDANEAMGRGVQLSDLFEALGALRKPDASFIERSTVRPGCRASATSR